MKKTWIVILMCLSCIGFQGCSKKAQISSAVGFPAYNRTPLMLNSQNKAGVLRLYQTRLVQRGNRL